MDWVKLGGEGLLDVVYAFNTQAEVMVVEILLNGVKNHFKRCSIVRNWFRENNKNVVVDCQGNWSIFGEDDEEYVTAETFSYKYFTEVYTSLTDLKSHYKQLAKQYHPDVVGGSTETMQTINEEFEIIKTLL